ncbi:CD44 antigen isoform X11 [Molossus molossus]|uniref:CD44 antigen isoform X11 n=1 Tax=Molossus molossus TaxID=27622 RepID=UPI001747880C|nr:CD44 antigen isoform X11 [Molossus molossus]
MDKFGWRAVWGLCLVQLSLAQIDLNITCRYEGVFHVEKNGRYSISRTEAADLCKAFDCTLPTMAQMEAALKVGFETCRYGFIEGHVVIPRIHPNSICAANNTGVYILTSNTSQYDTYCFNASAPPGEDCTSVTDLPNSFDGPISITIVNRDGTRYTKQGEYRTNPDDINASNTTDEDVSSGFSSERSTSGSYSIFPSHLPTMHPTLNQDSSRVSYHPEHPATSTDSNIISAGWEPTEEKEDERDKHPSHSGSGIDDEEDFISSTISTTPTQNRDWNQRSPGFFNPEVLLQTTTRMTDVGRSDTSDYGENWTQEPQPPVSHHEYHDEVETQHSTSTISAHDSHPNQRTTTQSQEDSSWTYFLDPISHPMGRGHQREKMMDKDSSHSTTLQPSAEPNTGLVEDLDRTGPLSVTTQDQDSALHPSERHPTPHGSGSIGHSSGSQEGEANTTSGPKRRPQIPEWLIILASLLALVLILAVCIAVNSRRRCGQKKKLVINSGNGAVEDRKPSGLNGEASKSQEMVHLVNKESSETPDQCMTADETRNLQNVDMKIGV